MKRLDQAVPTQSARRIYDFLGKRYDWFGGYEARAKERSIEMLKLAPGLKLLEVGVGNGRQYARLQAALGPSGSTFGIDVSHVMLKLTSQQPHALICQADARRLPFPAGSFDRVYSTYVLDLMPLADLIGILAEFRRVLKDGGWAVVAALTEGVNFPSRMLVAAWKGLYALSPTACAGCRPIRLAALVEQAGFKHIQRETIVQMAVPSEIILAGK